MLTIVSEDRTRLAVRRRGEGPRLFSTVPELFYSGCVWTPFVSTRQLPSVQADLPWQRGEVD